MKKKETITNQVSAIDLKSILQKEEDWAYDNQMDAIRNDLCIEVAWNRGYRIALKTIATRVGIKLEARRK